MAANDEGDKVLQFFSDYTARVRMEYGNAMALAGLDPEIIIAVQERVALGVVDWLEDKS